jgi:hypothetical protein
MPDRSCDGGHVAIQSDPDVQDELCDLLYLAIEMGRITLPAQGLQNVLAVQIPAGTDNKSCQNESRRVPDVRCSMSFQPPG